MGKYIEDYQGHLWTDFEETHVESQWEGSEGILEENEENFTLKFNTCAILLKDIKYVVKSNTTTWKNIYGLHKPSDYIVKVDDKDVEEDDVEEKVKIRGD